MNEWSSKGYYTNPQTPDRPPQARVYRQYWEENWDQVYGNTSWTMNSYKVKEHQKVLEIAPPLPTEDIGIPPAYNYKKKNDGPDPRFRKVINTEYQTEVDAENEKFGTGNKVYRPMFKEEKAIDDKVISFLKTPNDPPFFGLPRSNNSEVAKQKDDENMAVEVTKDPGFQLGKDYYLSCERSYPCENFRDVSQLKTCREEGKGKNNSAMNLKRSVSDCTLNKKVPFEGENGGEAPEKVRPYPSVSRLSKVQNWIKGHNNFPEKRRSVITVIGQTQTKSFSTILSEINQRRKLAKELDKHALCEAIMSSNETPPDVKNIVAKVDLVLPDGKVIYSTEKVYLSRDGKFTDANVYTRQSMEVLEAGDQKKKRFEMIPEKDSSASQVGRKSRSRRLKKSANPTKENLETKDNMKNFCDGTFSIMIWSLVGLLCLSIFFSVFFYAIKPSPSHYIIEFFKPKTSAWYEKLLFL